MIKIGSGRTKDLGIKFWEIVDGAGTRLPEFNHSRFPTTLSDAPVYFKDLDLDPKQCETVQAKAQAVPDHPLRQNSPGAAGRVF